MNARYLFGVCLIWLVLPVCGFAAAPATPRELPPSSEREATARALVEALVALPAEGGAFDAALSQQHIKARTALAKEKDNAIGPIVQALRRPANDPQRGELAATLDMISTPKATIALAALTRDPNDTVRTRAISAMGQRAYRSNAEGGSDEALPLLVKLLPNEPLDLNRRTMCAAMRAALEPRRGETEVKAGLQDLAHKTLTDLLKNDKAPGVRVDAACYLTMFGDNAGAEVIKAATIDLAGAPNVDDPLNMSLLDRLAPALEKISGQKFTPVPMSPYLSSDNGKMGALHEQRTVLAKAMAEWARANPAKGEGK